MNCNIDCIAIEWVNVGIWTDDLTIYTVDIVYVCIYISIYIYIYIYFHVALYQTLPCPRRVVFAPK